MAWNWQWDCKCFTCYWCCIPGRCSMFMKGIFGRLLFTAYTIGITALFIKVAVKQGDEDLNGLSEVGIFACFASLSASVLETVLTLCCKKYGEWKVFSPSVFIYLGCSTLELFLLNLHFVDRRRGLFDKCEQQYEAANSMTNVTENNCTVICTTLDKKLESRLEHFAQALIILLIIGRWLLPRGKMTLIKFSDMLIVYFGMSVDILDFLTQGLAVSRCNVLASQIVLILTSISLIQFTLDIELMLDKFDSIQRTKSIMTFLGIREVLKFPELRTILMNMLMQDLPFLVFRIYIIFFASDIVDQGAPTFFAIKNVMVLSLQSYRLWILIRKDESKIKIRMSMKNKETSGTDNTGDHDENEASSFMLAPKGETGKKALANAPENADAVAMKVETSNGQPDKGDFVTSMVDPHSGEPVHKTENVV